MSIQDEIPRSRLNLRYRTTIKGEAEMLELPFRLLVLGDLSLGTSMDRESDLESRRFRSLDGKNLDSVIEDMRMTMRFKVPNRVDPQEEDEELEVTLPVKNRKSFNPDLVAANVPKIASLLLLRRLLAEMQSNIDNRKELRRIVQEIYSNPEMLDSLKKELAVYAGYRIPQGTTNHKALTAQPQGTPAQESQQLLSR